MGQKTEILILLEGLAEFYNIPVKHGWKKELADLLESKIEVARSDLIYSWINRKSLPDYMIDNILDLDIPENLQILCENCKKKTAKISDAKKEYDLHGGGPPLRPEMRDTDHQMLGKAFDILRSKSVYRNALMANIDAFYNALETEKKHSECMERIGKLEDRLAALEKEREPEKNLTNGF